MSEFQSLWTARDLETATQGEWLVSPGPGFSPERVSYDLSSLNPNNIAVVRNRNWRRGASDDAPKLARLAADGKIVAAIIEHGQCENLGDLRADFPLLLVDNTRKALADLCRYRRRQFQGSVIAVTGTVGKTTCREMLLHALDGQGGTRATRGNNNNIAGVERTMAYTPIDAGYAIIEMGFGLPVGGIRTSSEAVRPHVALITALGLAHLDVLGDAASDLDQALDLVTEQKMGIVDGLQPDGTLVYPRGVRNRQRLLEIAKRKGVGATIGFGFEDDADVRLHRLGLDASGSDIEVRIGRRTVKYRLPLVGEQMALNSVAVLATVLAAGGDVQFAAERLETFEAVGGRARLFDFMLPDGGPARMIDDSFNATPDSIRSTLALLDMQCPPQGGRRIAVFGDIAHLGPREVDLHRDLARDVERSRVDRVFTVGPLMHHLATALPGDKRGPHVQNAAQVLGELRHHLRAGDVVTLKAATPMELTKVARALRNGRDSL